jgi:hypothetical protein
LREVVQGHAVATIGTPDKFPAGYKSLFHAEVLTTVQDQHTAAGLWPRPAHQPVRRWSNKSSNRAFAATRSALCDGSKHSVEVFESTGKKSQAWKISSIFQEVVRMPQGGDCCFGGKNNAKN